MKYTFSFSDEITVIANSEEEAFALADELVAPTAWAYDNSENLSVDTIDLVDVEEDEE